MKTKAKKFSHKLLALFMAVVMALTAFSGAFSAFAASKDVKYHDNDVEYNELAWRVLSDEQLATALLDYLDVVLADVGPSIDKLLAGALPTSGIYSYNYDNRTIRLKVPVLLDKTIRIYAHSIDEIFVTLGDVYDLLDQYGNLVGTLGNLQVGQCKGVTRSNKTSCEILQLVLSLLQKNINDYNGKDVFGEILRGGFTLGTVGSFVDLDLYGLIGGIFGVSGDRMKADFIYNLLQGIIFSNTNWFSAAEKDAFINGTATFVYDDVLLEKMTTELLQKINIEVTYNTTLGEQSESSRDRYAAIKELMEGGMTFAAASESIGADPNLCYTDDGNVYLFKYGVDPTTGNENGTTQKIALTTSDSLFAFGYKALDFAWKTVLKGTVGLLHVNYDVERGHGSNFDNVYYYWALKNGGWNRNDVASNYTAAKVEAWAASAASVYGAKDAAEFLGWVQEDLEFDRALGEDSTGSWKDIDAGSLFNKVRYSPLADYYFNMTTGPINLYFMQTGCPNIVNFFDTKYSNYNSLVAGLNDALVAAVKDIFVQRSNVYGGGQLPTMATVNPTTINAAAITQITTALTGNALKIVQYTADAIDSNILKAFYEKFGANAKLTESNLEEAMLPLLLACVGQINLSGHKLKDQIHPEDWDAIKDAEGLAYVCLSEYLSYVLPQKDYTGLVTRQNGKIVATLDGTLLPMARDAVAFVMQGYVPIRDASGHAWDVYTAPVNDSTTLFDLLNGVICYYGGEYNYTKNITKHVGAMGVAALLGVCGTDGRSSIALGTEVKNGKTVSKLWSNINLVANKLVPVLGVLQGKGAGNFDSYDLIWNDIVQGVLEIGDTSIHTTGVGGVSNFVNRLLSIISAAPIQSQTIVATVYDFLADLFNGLLGARYNRVSGTNGGQYATVIPARSTAHPFDDLLKRNVIVGTDGAYNKVGVLQKAITNFVEFSGYGTNGLNTYPDSIMRGLMFAIQAVNSFVPSILDTIGDHQLRMGSAEYADKTKTKATSGNAVVSTVDFTNNSTGVNNALVLDGQVTQLSRYYMKLVDAQVVSSMNSACSVTLTNAQKAQLIAPGETISLTSSSTYQPDSNKSTSFAATISYQICDASGNVLYGAGTNDDPYLTTTAYQYVTGATDWQTVVYPSERSGQLNANIEVDAANTSKTYDGYTAFTSKAFGGSGRLTVLYPQDIVLKVSDLSQINNFQFRVRNNASGIGNKNASCDGFYTFDDGQVYDDNTHTTVPVNLNNAIPVFDKETGAILKVGRYDVRIKGSGDDGWNRKMEWNGYSESDIETYVYGQDYAGVPRDQLEFRTHVAYTLTEAVNAGIIQAYHFNEAGVCEYVYMKTGGGNNYDTTLDKVSLRGPVEGIICNQGKMADIEKSKSRYTEHLFEYDGETPIQAGKYPVKLCAYSSNKDYGSATTFAANKECYLYVADDRSAGNLDSDYNALKSLMDNYRDADFKDASIKATVQEALLNVLAVQSSVITPSTAVALSDKTYLAPQTEIVATQYGDLAYVPFDNSNVSGMPIKVLADAHQGTDGKFYVDESNTMLIYSNVPVTDSTVSGYNATTKIGYIAGTDVQVIKGDDGKFYLLNTPSYEKEWSTTFGTPARLETNVQATNSKGDLLYERITYVYRDASGNKVNSDNNGGWACKFPATDYKIIPSTTVDNRGDYTKAADKIAYVKEQVEKAIKTDMANKLIDKISKVRTDLNNVNFDVVTYERMVQAAKRAERDFSIKIPYYEVKWDANGNRVLDADKNPIIDRENKKIKDWADYPTLKWMRESDDYEVIEEELTLNSSLSSVQVDEYIRLFNEYMKAVYERGYIGNKLEAELLCAAGNDQTKFTVNAQAVWEKVGYNDDGSEKWARTTLADISTTAATVPFGAIENGKLVNNGPVVFADGLWQDYTEALARVIAIAQEGNGTYAHKAAAKYQATADDYTCQVTDVYDAETDLQCAEIALERVVLITADENYDATLGTLKVDGVALAPGQSLGVAPESRVSVDGEAIEGYELGGFENIGKNPGQVQDNGDGTYTVWVKKDATTVTPIFQVKGADNFNVTASIVVAKNASGATDEVAVNGDYTVTIYDADDNEVLEETFAMSADSNDFTVSLPAGTYSAVITSEYALDREDVTIVVTDSDIEGPAIPVFACDFNTDTTITGADAITVYANASGDKNAYCDLNGDGTVTGADAIIVYACAAGTRTLAPITID